MNDNVLNFMDIIKKSVIEKDLFGKMAVLDIVICMAVACIVGLFIFAVYKNTFTGVAYSHSFNMSLVLMTMITSLIIMTVSSNIVLSLGMVGALSIVRFRTAVKDPMDIVYLFLAIAAGISNGAGLYQLSLIGTLSIGLVIVVLTRFKSNAKSYVLVVNYTDDAHEKVKDILSRFNYQIKSKSVRDGLSELTVELKLKNDNTRFVSELSESEGVRDAILISYGGGYVE